MSDQLHVSSSGEPSLLWYAVFAGPVAWVLDVAISYPLVQWECGAHSAALLHLVSFLCGLLALSGCMAGASFLRRLPSDVPLSGGRTIDRMRFMAIGSIALSAMFVLVVIADAIPRFFIGPCQQ